MPYLLTSEEYLDQRKTLRVDLVAVDFTEGASEALDISITHSLASRFTESAVAEVESKKKNFWNIGIWDGNLVR